MLGDNFYDYGIRSENDPRWSSDFEQAFLPNCPWYAVLGNHDYLGNPDAQIRRDKKGHWNMPSRYYDKKFLFPGMENEGAHVFFLDTFELSPAESLLNSRGMGMAQSQWDDYYRIMNHDRQLKWLDNGLACSTMRWKIVVGHYPIFSNGHHGDNPELYKNLLPILERHRVDFYMCGHDHHLAHLNHGDTQFLISGTGCRHMSPISLPPSYSLVPDRPGVAFILLYPTHALFGFWNLFYRSVLPNSLHPIIHLTLNDTSL
jgi:acid phosphatase